MKLQRGAEHLVHLRKQGQRALCLLRCQQPPSASLFQFLSSSSQFRPFTSTSIRRQDVTKPSPKGIPYAALTIGIPKETFPLEKRVAASPESVARLVKAGFKNIQIESNAGSDSFFSNAAYEQAGGTIVEGSHVWKSDIVLKVTNTQTQDWEREKLILDLLLEFCSLSLVSFVFSF